MIMKNLALLTSLVLASACGPKSAPSNVGNAGGSADQAGPAHDTRTELERRRDAACETLGPRMTSCALEDAKADYAAGKVSKQQFEQDTASGVLAKNTEKFIEACTHAQYSSRQVRVLEVCQREESECNPMLACLDNLDADPKVKSVGP